MNNSTLVLLTCLLSSAAWAVDGPALPTTHNLATLPAAQFDGGWSAPAEEGGVAFRQALAGKYAHVRIKAWWEAGDLRPAEGERFVCEVRYRDVLTRPAQFLAFSGLGRNFGDSVLHRFGGASDGQWRTAAIPVPWSMVARLQSTVNPAAHAPDMTAVAIAADKDLPVASITVRRAVPDDEARFYAECRALIAGDQQSERAATPPPAVTEKPAVQGPLAAYPWEPLCRLFPNSPVPTAMVGKPVQVRMCLNQIESASFGVYANGTALGSVDYEVTPLVDANGRALKAVIERRTAEYALMDGLWTPMRLWPAFPADIPAGSAQWLFLNIETRRGESAPGVYRGRILIKAKEGTGELPLEVEVLPVDLLSMDEAGLTMVGCYQNTPPLQDIAFQRRYNYNGAMLWYNSFSFPTVLRDGKVVVDFTYADDWMAGIRKRGFHCAVWYLGGDPFGFPRTMNVFAHLGTLDGKRTRDQWCREQMAPEHRNAILPSTRPVFVDWMRHVNAHALAAGWPELLPTPHDEPQKWAGSTVKGDKAITLGTGPWIKPYFKDGCAAIREADPRIRIYGCIHHVKDWKGIPDLWSIFIDDIDVYNTNAVMEDKDIGNRIRGASASSLKRGGREKWFWQYSGTGGGVPANQRYTFGFYYAAFGSTGFGQWAYNWGDKWDLSGRKGDLAVMAWATPYETIPSPWLEGQRIGLDDRRIIATYQKRFAKDAEAMAALQAVLKESADSRSENSGNDTVTNFFEALDDASKLTRWRNTLLDRLAQAAP